MVWTKDQIQRAYDDFRVFVFMVWRMIGLPEPTPLQYDMANTLQNTPSDRFILEAFRGAAKSFITCAYVVWCLWRDPQLKIEIISASKDRADANAVFIKRIIMLMPFLEFLPGREEGKKDMTVNSCTSYASLSSYRREFHPAFFSSISLHLGRRVSMFLLVNHDFPTAFRGR